MHDSNLPLGRRRQIADRLVRGEAVIATSLATEFRVSEDAIRRKECLGRARLGQGRAAEAIQILAFSPTRNWGYLAIAYSRAGRRAEAEKLMAEAPALDPDRRGDFQFALAFAGLRDRDRTLERLERLARVGPVRMGFTLNSPEFAFLRGDPRVKALRNRLGLPE